VSFSNDLGLFSCGGSAYAASVVMLQSTALGPFALAAEMRPRAPTLAALSWIGIRQDALLMADASEEPPDGSNE
jgi:hypothetical protein